MNKDARKKLFGEIYNRHYHRLRRFSIFSSWNSQDNDLLQEIWLNIWNSLPNFREACSLDTWVTRVAVNSALMHRRREGRRQRNIILDPAIDQETLKSEEDRGLRIDTELRKRLHDCVSQLQPRDRMIVSLHLEEMSHREIAKVIGIGESHVGVLLHRLKPILKKCITGEKT